MKKNLVLWFFIGFVCTATSQVLTITNKTTGEPIYLATIMSAKPKVFATTNVQGQADITAFKGAEKIVIRNLGFKTEIKSYAALAANNFELKLSVAINQFEEVVISATRWRQSSKNIPSKIAVISPKEVALFNPQTTADLLGSSGEVFIQKSQQGGGSPMIRGFSANRLLYTVDGVRMNTAIFRSGNLQNVISLDPLSIENTEVFFGPGSIIYGSDAIGGVMAFQTLTPQLSLTDKPLIKASLVSRYASANNEISNHFDINVGWGKWAVLSSITHSKFDDLRMGKNGPDEYLKTFLIKSTNSVDRVFQNPDSRVQNPTAYSQTNIMQKISFKPNNNFDIQYGFHYSITSDYSRFDRLIELQSNGLPGAAVWNYGPQKWMMNNFSVTHFHKNKIYDQFTLRLAHQLFEESRIDRRLNHHRLRTQAEEVSAYSANADFEKVMQRHIFYYGFEYVLNDVKSKAFAVDVRNGSEILVPNRYPASNWSSYATYLNYQFTASDKLLFQSGLRFNAFDLKSDFTQHLDFYPFDFKNTRLNNAATTGSFGFIFSPSESWKFSMNASTGFRAPNVDDIGKIFDFVGEQVIVPNTNLSAEYAYNGELNVAKIFGDILKIDVSAFYTYLNNAMVRRTFQLNGQDSILYNGQLSEVYAIQNSAYATVYGINAGLELKLPSGVGFSSRYNFQLGVEEMDNGEITPSRHAAPAYGITRLTYQKEDLQLQFYAFYSAEVQFDNLNEGERQKPAIYAKDNNGNPYSPSWYTLNFKAMYRFQQHLSISAGIENLTDQRYRPYSSGLVAAGRNFILSLRLNF